ncbi:MAG: organic hydroperoxide reductase OsmC/OhrA [Paracoccaceae bacterium]|jgi:organic hydroperoxide reductase OsmC/OhrA
MSDLSIELHWQRAEPVSATGAYSDAHTVQMNRVYDITADSAQMAEMQARAHRYCFIANTLADSIEINTR